MPNATISISEQLNDFLNDLKEKRIEATKLSTTMGKMVAEACYSYFKDGKNIVPPDFAGQVEMSIDDQKPVKPIGDCFANFRTETIQDLINGMPSKPIQEMPKTPSLKDMLNELEIIGNRILEIAR